MAEPLKLDTLVAALQAVLPAADPGTLGLLACALTDVASGALTPELAQWQLAGRADLVPVLDTLRDRELAFSNALVSFAGAQTGDVMISGDVVGGSKIMLQLGGVLQSVTFSGGSLGQVVAHQTNYYNASPPVAVVGPAFQVPYPSNPLFRGRDAELDEMERAILGSSGQLVAVVPAITGTGGIGKTQLASQFAHKYKNRFPGGVFWLNMETISKRGKRSRKPFSEIPV
jgi:hypothetical protein